MNILITQLPGSSWEQYKNIRLKAVESDPNAFGCTLAEELARTPEQWKTFLKNMWFALDTATVVGMIGMAQRT